MLLYRQPKLCGSSLDFEFIRECMKINKIRLKIRLKFQFCTQIEIKMTYHVFVFCYLLSLRLYSHLEGVLSTFKILSCTNSKKNGKAGDSQADCSSSKLHKSHKNGPNLPKLPSKDRSIICLSLLCFWSLKFHPNR